MMDGYRLCRRDRQGRQGGGVALYVREGLDCMALAAGDNTVESPWVRMKGKANMVNVVVGFTIVYPARTTAPINSSTRN